MSGTLTTTASESIPMATINVQQQGIKARDDRENNEGADFGFCSYFLIGLSYFLTIVFFPIAILTNIKVCLLFLLKRITRKLNFLDCTRIRKSGHF